MITRHSQHGLVCKGTLRMMHNFQVAQWLKVLQRHPTFLKREKLCMEVQFTPSPIVWRILEETCRISEGLSQENFGEIQVQFCGVRHCSLIECATNNRPLTYEYEEFGHEMLTPAHLLLGYRVCSMPHDMQINATNHNIHQRTRYFNSLREQLWRRWLREYLMDLREYH